MQDQDESYSYNAVFHTKIKKNWWLGGPRHKPYKGHKISFQLSRVRKSDSVGSHTKDSLMKLHKKIQAMNDLFFSWYLGCVTLSMLTVLSGTFSLLIE